MAQGRFRPDEIDTSRPHPARIYDYALGGKTHYPADAKAAEEALAVFPGGQICARVNRAFMHRTTRWLARETDVRQFLDVGSGIPTEPNLHQVAQEIAPESRIVYADNDPIVLTYAQALLRSSPEGRTAYLHADFREPESLLASGELQSTLDLSRPIALSLNAVLHYMPDEDKPYEIVAKLVDALAPGSYLVLSHITPEFAPEAWAKITELNRAGGIPTRLRDKQEVSRFFAGLELVEPGVQVPHRWRPEPGEPPADASDTDVSLWAGLARKP